MLTDITSAAARAWNSLPTSVRTSSTHLIFLCHLRSLRGGFKRGGEERGGEGVEGRGEEAFLVMWPRRLSALNPPLRSLPAVEDVLSKSAHNYATDS